MDGMGWAGCGVDGCGECVDGCGGGGGVDGEGAEAEGGGRGGCVMRSDNAPTKLSWFPPSLGSFLSP